MGKNKLKKFAEMEQMRCVHQYPPSTLGAEGCPLRGRWNAECFHRDAPLVVELGCGKGEYAVGLAQERPGNNYIGVDIKGARMWTGAVRVRDLGLDNCAFLRTDIGMLPMFFDTDEVSEIWITFPDPQMKKVNKRLTGTRFLTRYRQFLRPGGIIHLKTDSPFLYAYTREMLRANGISPMADTSDLYGDGNEIEVPQIKTFYEQQWLSRGMKIKYLSFTLPTCVELVEPDIEIEPDPYRSLPRGQL